MLKLAETQEPFPTKHRMHSRSSSEGTRCHHRVTQSSSSYRVQPHICMLLHRTVLHRNTQCCAMCHRTHTVPKHQNLLRLLSTAAAALGMPGGATDIEQSLLEQICIRQSDSLLMIRSSQSHQQPRHRRSQAIANHARSVAANSERSPSVQQRQCQQQQPMPNAS
jgi:hypothetical protein